MLVESDSCPTNKCRKQLWIAQEILDKWEIKILLALTCWADLQVAHLRTEYSYSRSTNQSNRKILWKKLFCVITRTASCNIHFIKLQLKGKETWKCSEMGKRITFITIFLLRIQQHPNVFGNRFLVLSAFQHLSRAHSKVSRSSFFFFKYVSFYDDQQQNIFLICK